jgi:hypothetical protein
MFGKPLNTLLTLGVLATAVVVAPAEAQVTATMVLKNGQRHTGQQLYYRMDRREVSVRSSLHEAPRVPVDQVEYVDFGGTPDVNVNLSGSEQALVMRDGSIVKGQVIELGHQNPENQTTPFLVVFRTSGGEERRLPVNQVARVYFSDSRAGGSGGGASPGAPGIQVPEGQGVAVPGNAQWTPTGLTVRRGEVVNFNTTGEVRLSSDPEDIAGSAGSRAQRYSQNAPLPRNYVGALIARVGNGAPFPIGNQTTVTMPAAGQLFLGINDDHVADNSGGFRVELRRSANRR